MWAGVSNLNIVNLINLNYRQNDSDLTKGFVQRLPAVTTNVSTDDLVLLRRRIAALRYLSRNNNINITPSNKHGSVVFIYHSHIHEYAKCTWDVYNIYT